MFGNHSTGKPNRAGSNLPRDQCRCPVPPAMTHGGGSWRSGSAATGLPGQRCHAVFFICSHCDRGHRYCSTRVPRASPPPAAAVRQPPPPAEPGRPARSSRSPAGVPAAASSASARDGSRFPFDHFPGIIRLWNGRCESRASSGGPQPLARKHSLALWLRCRICGRAGRFIDPFPRIPRRR